MAYCPAMTLREWLEANELTNTEFARRIGSQESTVRKWRLGLRRPRAEALVKVVQATGGQVTANDFFMTDESAA